MTDYDLQASECRKEARNIDIQYWDDDEINTYIDLRTAKFHKDIGRTTAWTLADNPIEYKLAKLAIMKVVASDLMGAVEAYAEDAQKKLEEYTEIITELTSNTTLFETGGLNLADELESVNYEAVQSENTPDIGVDNGL